LKAVISWILTIYLEYNQTWNIYSNSTVTGSILDDIPTAAFEIPLWSFVDNNYC
jgi:hypothetical protein